MLSPRSSAARVRHCALCRPDSRLEKSVGRGQATGKSRARSADRPPHATLCHLGLRAGAMVCSSRAVQAGGGSRLCRARHTIPGARRSLGRWRSAYVRRDQLDSRPCRAPKAAGAHCIARLAALHMRVCARSGKWSCGLYSGGCAGSWLAACVHVCGQFEIVTSAQLPCRCTHIVTM